MKPETPLLIGLGLVVLVTTGCLGVLDDQSTTTDEYGDTGHVFIDRHDPDGMGAITEEDAVVDYNESPWSRLPGADEAFSDAYHDGSGSIPLNRSTAERLAGLLDAWNTPRGNGSIYIRYRDRRYITGWMSNGSRYPPRRGEQLPSDSVVAYRSGDELVVLYHIADRGIIPPTEATIVTIAGNDSSRHYCPRQQHGTLRIPMNEVFPRGAIVALYEDDRWLPGTTPCREIGGFGPSDSIESTNWRPRDEPHASSETAARESDRGEGRSGDVAEPADERVIVRSDRNATLDVTLTRNGTSELDTAIPIHAGGQVVTNITRPGRYRLSVTLENRTATRNVTVTSGQLGDCNRGTIAIVVFEDVLEIQREQELVECAP